LKLLLIDESKAKDYLLCVVEIEANQAPTARLKVGSVRKKRQRLVHFVAESESRRRAILDTYSRLTFKTTIYKVSGAKELDARTACLRAMIEGFVNEESYSLVFDMDENHLVSDRRTIRNALAANGILEFVEYRHKDPHEEILLWLPDAIAWSFARGGVWRSQLRGFNVGVRNLD
jgi:hypothetical protein